MVTYTDWYRDSYYSAIESLVGKRSKVGLEFDHVSLDTYGKIKKVLPKADLVDVGDATMKMRMVKTAEEIEVTKTGARIAEIGGYACRAAIAEGVPEYEIAMASTQAMTREIAATYPHGDLMDSKAFLFLYLDLPWWRCTLETSIGHVFSVFSIFVMCLPFSKAPFRIKLFFQFHFISFLFISTGQKFAFSNKLIYNVPCVKREHSWPNLYSYYEL